MRESFLIYKSFYEPIKDLSNDDLGQLFRAIFEYQLLDKEPANTNRIFMAFQFFKNQFRLDNDKYEKVVNKNRINGLSGGRPKSKQKPNNPPLFLEPKKADNDNGNGNGNVNDKEFNLNNDLEMFEDWLETFNMMFNRNHRPIKKVIASYNARIKEGYEQQELLDALENVKNNPYHIETKFTYITPEFMTRADKIEKYKTHNI
jgi:hypothetical protein